jgi:predicted dehydrogenase
LAAINAGKPVYLEKPMTTDAASALRIKEAADQRKVKVTIAHYRREQPLFLHIKKLLADGMIGDVHIVNLRFFQPHHSPLVAI